jgi:hypothetical protein
MIKTRFSIVVFPKVKICPSKYRLLNYVTVEQKRGPLAENGALFPPSNMWLKLLPDWYFAGKVAICWPLLFAQNVFRNSIYAKIRNNNTLLISNP